MSDTDTATAPDALADVADTMTVTAAEREALADGENDTGTAGAAPAKAEPEPEPPAAEPPAAEPEPEPAAPAPVATAAPTPQLMAVPEPPKDFEAAFKALDEQYDNNELDDDERNAAYRALTIEQAKFEGQKASVEAFNAAQLAQAQAAATQSFNDAAAAFAAANKDFMGNPLRAQAMQQAINLVDQETKGELSHTALIERAAKMAFDAHGWNPDAHKPAPANPAAQALKDRMPPNDRVPRTLGDAPTSGQDTGTSRFGQLDTLGVQEMEAAISRMSAAEQEAWLKEVDSPLN